jgi:hypothetical protein
MLMVYFPDGQCTSERRFSYTLGEYPEVELCLA